MRDFFETVRHRHSVRKYRTDLPVESAKLHAVLETASSAPSAGDLQAYRIIVVSDASTRVTLARLASNQTFMAEAPVILVFCTDPERSGAKYGNRGRRLYALQDATIAATYAQLAAVAAGMATAWVGMFDEGEVSAALNLEPGLVPIAMLTLGYAAELPEDTPRRPLAETVVFR